MCERGEIMTINYDLIKNNLYQAVNGAWLEKAEIPNDKVSTGGFLSVRDQIEESMMEEVEKMVKGDIHLSQPEMQEFIKYYKQASDFSSRNEEGTEPIKKLIQKLFNIQNYEDLQRQAADLALAGVYLPFEFGISPDMKDTKYYALYLGTPDTILPDKTYYGTEQGDQLLAVFQKMMNQVLTLMGINEVQRSQLLERAFAFDQILSERVKTREEEADYTKKYNPRSVNQVKDYSQILDLTTIIEELIGQEGDQVIVTHPEFYESYNEIVSPDNFNDIISWMIVHTLNSRTDVLSEDIRQAGSLYELTLSGRPETQSPQKHAYYCSIEIFDQPFGIYYGEKYFGQEARDDVEDMVDEMIDVYKKRLRQNKWLSQATIDQAIVKLDALIPLIGYPDTYIELYKHYQVNEQSSFYDNQERFGRLRREFKFSRWGKKVDRTEWGMSAATVNAYFNPMSNVICFPAAILQKPFYDFNQSRSENYGGIGAVIAHEISHAFDNNGAKFDEKGNLNNWWQDEDFETFNQKSEAMVKLFDGMTTEVGQVNGRLTVSENIADQGGLTAAYEAMLEEEDADPAAFFMNWARIWCQKARPEYQELLLNIDVHSPAVIRANVQVQLIDGFYDIFNIQEGDGMYMAPENRLEIW